jgi:hypothetical protein
MKEERSWCTVVVREPSVFIRNRAVMDHRSDFTSGAAGIWPRVNIHIHIHIHIHSHIHIHINIHICMYTVKLYI